MTCSLDASSQKVVGNFFPPKLLMEDPTPPSFEYARTFGAVEEKDDSHTKTGFVSAMLA